MTKYVEKDGLHINPGKSEIFKGNMLFSSLSKMNYNLTSRKDDLISMCYVLTYLFHEGELLNINAGPLLSSNECFELAIKIKRLNTIEDICFGKSKCLNDFFHKIFDMEFDEAPDYARLSRMLKFSLRPKETIQNSEERLKKSYSQL